MTKLPPLIPPPTLKPRPVCSLCGHPDPDDCTSYYALGDVMSQLRGQGGPPPENSRVHFHRCCEALNHRAFLRMSERVLEKMRTQRQSGPASEVLETISLERELTPEEWAVWQRYLAGDRSQPPPPLAAGDPANEDDD